MNRPLPTSPDLTPGELQSPRSDLSRSPRSIGESWVRSVSTEQEHSNQKMTGRGQNDRPRHWPTTPTHDRDNSDHPPGSFPRGNPEMYVLEADDLEAGGLLRALAESQPAWRREALCRDKPLAIFFPGRGQSSKPALTICGPCQVRPECLAEALAEELDHGIRGGMTARARVAARKAQSVNDTEAAA
jgi:WhiB family redox-sensing transcriptional regulator